ncbi:hypothetical protein ACHAQA_008929 [Verticillium albo-atrum]
MKTAAAATVLSLATIAAAQSFCAITCFQNVVTEFPPLDCTEANMYLCFCKSTSLQGHFLDCVYEDCAADADNAVAFGVNLCQELGAPITVPPRPVTTTTAAPEPSEAPETTTEQPEAPVTTTTAAPVESEAPAPEESEAPAEDTTTTTAAGTAAPTYAAPSESAAESAVESASPSGQEEEQSTTVVSVPTASGNGTDATPTHVEVDAGVMNSASGLLVAAGAILAAAQLI